MSEEVEECVESVLDDHPEMDESSAYAICYAQQQGEVDDEDAFHEAVVQLADAGDTDRLTRVGTRVLGQKQATIAGEQAPLRPRAVPDVDPDNPPEEFAEALEAEDFVIYGKASIEKFDSGGENSDVPEILDMEAMERSLDRFFGSEKAPGIISIGHDDIPVGRPLEEYSVEEDIAIEIDGDTYEFDAGDTLTTHIEDGDGDGRPELWMLADLANDTDIARKARLGVLTGEIDGYSVTFGRKAFQREGAGRRVTDLDLFSATLAPGDLIANEGAEFDLAAFKAEMNRYQSTGTDDAAHGLLRAAEDLTRDLRVTMSQTDNTPDDVDSFLSRLGQKLQSGESADADEQHDDEDTGQKADEDAGQKQPEGDGDTDENPTEDLIAALAEHMNASTEEVKAALTQVGQNAGEDMDDDEDDEGAVDDAEAKTETDSADGDVNINFGAKLDEHGVITEDDLGEKFAEQREEIVDELGQKLAEANKETVEEIAQKMDTTSTPTPAGGSFQDSEDFETHLDDIAGKEGW